VKEKRTPKLAKDTVKNVQEIKNVDKTYWDMTPQEKYAFVQALLKEFSPNEEIRNSKK
jgi:hypothetical protein